MQAKRQTRTSNSPPFLRIIYRQHELNARQNCCRSVVSALGDGLVRYQQAWPLPGTALIWKETLGYADPRY